MHRLLRETEQGGAAVEFALCTMLLVPMVIYTIYSGEAVTAGIKAMEAEISAGWDITAYRTHDYQGGSASSLLQGAATRSAQKVNEALKDFNSFRDTGSDKSSGIYGEMTLVPVECRPRDSNNGGNFGPTLITSSRLHADGWVGCTAEVKFENRRAPKQAHAEFYEGKPKVIQGFFEKLTMGGLGRPFKGCDNGCARDGKRGFLVLTDDWGLEDPGATTVESYGGGNPKYYNVGKDLFTFGGVPGAATGILTGVTGGLIGLTDQGSTSKFKMGYLRTIETKRSFGNDGGGMSLHLTPQHEVASEATKQTAQLSGRAYGRRVRDHYLAMQDKNWNGQ